MNDNSKIWQLCLDTLEKQELPDSRKIDKIIMESVFRSAKISSINDNKVVITTPYSFNVETIKNNQKDIEEILSGMLASPITVEILGEEDFKKTITVQNEQPFKDNLNKTFTFDNFVVGSSNRMAQNAALLVSSNPGSNFNPLFIYSNPGLGKTHLLNAIGNYAKETNPSLKIRYITSKEFVDEVIGAMKGKNSNDIYLKYKNLDMLLIDDIQFLFNKEKISEIFFHIFNELINNNKQIVITSDIHPSDLKGIENRLISRFSSGLTVSVGSPEFETAKAILLKKLEYRKEEIMIEDQVLDYLATRFNSDVRKLEGALNELMFKAVLYNPDSIHLEFVKEIFKENPTVATEDELTPDKIKNVVCDYYGLTKTQIESKSRTKNIANARHIAVYLCRRHLHIPFVKIGFEFGNRDHSTIMSSYEKMNKLLKDNKTFQQAVMQIEQKLGISN